MTSFLAGMLLVWLGNQIVSARHRAKVAEHQRRAYYATFNEPEHTHLVILRVDADGALYLGGFLAGGNGIAAHPDNASRFRKSEARRMAALVSGVAVRYTREPETTREDLARELHDLNEEGGLY